MKRTGRTIGARRRLVGLGGFALTAVITVFHGGLLWQRLTDGSMLQPVVVVRWIVSALLVFALLRLWRRGLPVLRGRRAGVLWLVVVLLHAFTPGASLPAVEQVSDGILPAALAMLALLVLGAAIGVKGGSSSAGRPTYRRPQRFRRASAGWSRVLFSRPPPVSLRP